MSVPERDLRVQSLIQGYLDGSLTQEECRRLHGHLRESPGLITVLLAGLHEDLWIQEAVWQWEQDSAADLAVHTAACPERPLPPPLSPADEERVAQIRTLAERQLQTYLAEQEAQVRRQRLAAAEPALWVTLVESLVETVGRTLRWVGRAAVGVVVAGVLVLVVLACMQTLRSRHAAAPLPAAIASLVKTVHARWDVDPNGTSLRPGRLTLWEGLAELRFARGAEVLLAAPCTINAQSSERLTLERGSLTAHVPPEAIGFQIDTPHSRIDDLGTDFGVRLRRGLRTEIHVFQGQVQVQAAGGSSPPRRLTTGQGATADSTGHVRVVLHSDFDRSLLRTLPRTACLGVPGRCLDLTDVACGGNGFGYGHRVAGIHPVTGMPVPRFTHERRGADARYVAVPSRPYVDGVFVPAARIPTQITSAGHRHAFAQSSGDWFTEIGFLTRINLEKQDPDPLVIDGRLYDKPTQPALGLHANLGITFDLGAIRQTLPETRVTAFSAYCALGDDVGWERRADAVFHVLVDGTLRFERRLVVPEAAGSEVTIGLDDTDRFLTLACTEGTQNNGDWSVWARPILLLETPPAATGASVASTANHPSISEKEVTR